MSVRIRSLGVAAYELVTHANTHILCDPFIDENPVCPIKARDLDPVDLIIVSHAAFDHLGDTEHIARRTGAPVVCGAEIKSYLMARGLPASQIRATTWGIQVEVAGVVVQPLECHHWSILQMPDGSTHTGNPMAFVVHASPNTRFYHYGDTAIFSDMKLQAELYRPTIGAIGMSQPWEIVPRVSGPGRLLTGELSPREAALAAQWLGLDTVLPCHFGDLNHPQAKADLDTFIHYLNAARERGEHVPNCVVLAPGEWLTIEA